MHNLPDFTKAKILVVGDIMLDRYWFGDAARISPEAPVPVVKIRQSDERPGGAGNVALNIASLGAKVTLLGITGQDEVATTLENLLAKAHVTNAILKLPDLPTITKLRIISRNQQLLRLDFEEKFPEFDPIALFDSYKNHLTKVNLVILSDYNKGTLLEIAPELIKLAKAANVSVLVDPKGTDFSLYRGADIITPNFKEFEALMGPCANNHEIVQKGQKLLKEYDIKALLLTRGEYGMMLIRPHAEEIHLPAHAREVFDVTGAGDTVIGILGAALSANATLRDAMSIANLAASLVVSKLGAATVSVFELEVADKSNQPPSARILSEDQLLTAISEVRLQGKKIVFTNGCFDILHAGHVKYLQEAKQLGDYLVVAVNDDESVSRLKGPTRPINNVEQRMAVLASLSAVDSVISFADDTPERLLKKLQPEILVKGGDYGINEVVGAEIVFSYGGNVRVLGVIKNLSTTKIIDRAKSMAVKESTL